MLRMTKESCAAVKPTRPILVKIQGIPDRCGSDRRL